MNISLFGISFHLFELPLIFFLICYFVKDNIENGLTLQFEKNSWLWAYIVGFVFFICSILLSGLNAYDDSLVFKSLFKWFEIAVVTFLIFSYVQEKSRFIIIYNIFLASSLLALIAVFARIASGEFTIFSYRIFPSYESAIVFALVLPLLSKRHVVLSSSVLFVSLIGIVLSLSRAAWLAVGILIVYSFFYFNAKMKKAAIVFIFIALLVGLLTPQIRLLVGYKISSFFQEENLSNNVRTNLLKRAFEAFSDFPLTGVGAENFPEYIIQEGQLSGLFARDYSILTPHNYFVQLLAEQGLFGFVSFLFLFFAIFMVLFKPNKSMKNQVMFKYLFGLRLVFIVFLINLMFGYIASQFRFYFILLMGSSLAFLRLDDADESSAQGSLPREI